jgi:crotonobetainyl-CoA:carnitine CoA-transferase CaiB-like acyl-CoA transferase
VTDQPTVSGPLSGVRVIELGVWVAGPAAAGLLADWGADVVKVEPPSGDPQRNVFGAVGVAAQAGVPPFELDNRGKRSVVLDLTGDDGRAHLDQLLATADVFITNIRPEALRRLGAHHDDVLARHPHLVYGSLTGYGLDGPEAGRAGYDIGAFWARSGLAHTLVPPGELPPALRSGMGDHTTGLALAAGVLAKLHERQRTGRGGLVATSLLRTGMYTLGWDIGIVLRFGKRESTRPRTRVRAPLINSYQSGDGHGFWLLLLESDRHWPALCAALDRPDWIDGPAYADAAARLANCDALIAAIDAVCAASSMSELAERFDRHDVWWAPIQSIAEVIEDPQAAAAGAFVDMTPQPGDRPYRAVNSPVDFDGFSVRPGPVPGLGEHTADVLSRLP